VSDVGRRVEVRQGAGWRFGRVTGDQKDGKWTVCLSNGRVVEVGGDDVRFVVWRAIKS
jgi:biotin-(acetyl-CoA carboxylase) ligase